MDYWYLARKITCPATVCTILTRGVTDGVQLPFLLGKIKCYENILSGPPNKPEMVFSDGIKMIASNSEM
jgi:hypothetical protein